MRMYSVFARAVHNGEEQWFEYLSRVSAVVAWATQQRLVRDGFTVSVRVAQ